MTSTAGPALYQELLLQHARAPRHVGRLAHATRSVEARNALCGDVVRLDVALDQARRLTGAFESEGCALCRASASILLDAVSGETEGAALALGEELRRAFAPSPPAALLAPERWPGDVRALLDVRAYPARTRCALLAWEALAEALGAPR